MNKVPVVVLRVQSLILENAYGVVVNGLDIEVMNARLVAEALGCKVANLLKLLQILRLLINC
jgi:hypothetical protein